MADKPKLHYQGQFNPGALHRPEKRVLETADERENPVYVYGEDVVLAVNVAIATGRPLLVRGESGSGKSTLAKNAADSLGWRYYERVITSTTKARDLLYEVDLLRRLHDAQRQGADLPEDYTPYIRPGPLWWAFDRASAARRGAADDAGVDVLGDRCTVDHARAVVLLDEIDKADPDVPNNLLVPLGSLQFEVEETGVEVKTKSEHAPLVFITTNNERELPLAFLRRCVEVELTLPTRTRLIDIGHAHFSNLSRDDLGAIADALTDPDRKKKEDDPLGISPAEFLDTARATDDLKISCGTKLFKQLAGITYWKHGREKPVSERAQ